MPLPGISVGVFDMTFNPVYLDEEFPFETLISYIETIKNALKDVEYGYVIPDETAGFAVWKLGRCYITFYTPSKE